MLFSALAEVIGKHMAPALPALIAIVTKALGDPHQGVRLAALRAVEQLVPLVMDEPHVLAFHALVAKLLEVGEVLLRRARHFGEEECQRSSHRAVLLRALCGVSCRARPAPFKVATRRR